MIQIYVLKDPRTLEIRYVGATSQQLKRRLTGHIGDTKLKNSNSYKINWIKQLLLLGLRPIIESVEIVRESNWIERERYWYSFYKTSILTNSRDGGAGVFKKDTNSIERSSQAKFKAIDQYSLDGKLIKTWECIRDAELFYSGKTKGSIKVCLRGGTKSSHGFRWCFTGEVLPLNSNFIPKRPLTLVHSNGTETQYRSIAACSKAFGLGNTTLHKYVEKDNKITEDIVQTVVERYRQPGREEFDRA